MSSRPPKLELTQTSCTPGGIGHFLGLEFAAKGGNKIFELAI
jgi:hypothetical protein